MELIAEVARREGVAIRGLERQQTDAGSQIVLLAKLPPRYHPSRCWMPSPPWTASSKSSGSNELITTHSCGHSGPQDSESWRPTTTLAEVADATKQDIQRVCKHEYLVVGFWPTPVYPWTHDPSTQPTKLKITGLGCWVEVRRA